MRSKKISFIYESIKFLKNKNSIENNLGNIVFFFPAYHLGGAERAHLDILKVFKDYNTSCVITSKSNDNIFKSEFEKYTSLIDLGEYTSIPYTWYSKQFADIINRKNNIIIFGCNSSFFYKMIPYLEEHVRIIDLLHAFSPECNDSMENISLPYINRINIRIVLGKKTYEDYKVLYEDNKIESSFLNRVRIIPNKIDVPDIFLEKPDSTIKKILFVSRNSIEKRVNLLLDIAKECYNKNLPAEFNLIGNFPSNISNLPNVKVIGVIDHIDKLNKIYQESDIILITSYREGFPMVILEAMAYGVIPISTNVGEVPNFINNRNKNGFIVYDKSIPQYLNSFNINTLFYKESVNNFVKIIECLSNDPEYKKSISKNAYLSVKENFSSKKHSNSYLNLFLNEI